ncbi:MAG: hypothetical protein VZR24_14600 [Butyrivibrio hungatei]|nr:hypothetical protein [Butyrivibrio hungatei]
MKLKYYLRGIGLGVIITAIIMGFALGAGKAPISDAEVIEKAKGLGMVEGGVLSDYSDEDASGEDMLPEDAGVSASADKMINTASGADGGPSFKDTSASNSAAAASVADIKADADKKVEADTGVGSPAVANGISGAAYKNSSAAASLSSKDLKDADKNKDKDKDKNKEKLVIDNKKKEEVTEEPEEASEVPAEEPNNTEENTQPEPTPAEPVSVQVTISGGSSSDKVAKILYDAGLVDDAVKFNRFLIESHLDTRIHSGNKNIMRGASYEDIAKAITQ